MSKIKEYNTSKIENLFNTGSACFPFKLEPFNMASTGTPDVRNSNLNSTDTPAIDI